MRTGTHHFTTLRAARDYYAMQGEDAEVVLAEGRIAIGKPRHDATPDRDGRYWIEEKEAAEDINDDEAYEDHCRTFA